MRAPEQPRFSRLTTVMLATIPLVLAAITIWMVRDAIAGNDGAVAEISVPVTSTRSN